MEVASIDVANSFPVRTNLITFKTAIRILAGTGAGSDEHRGLVFELGDSVAGIALWLDDTTINAHAGEAGAVTGATATYDNTVELPEGLELNIIIAIRPGNGQIIMWGNGTELARSQASALDFDAGEWASASPGSFASAVQGTIVADVTQTGAPSGFEVIEPLSVFSGSVPRQFIYPDIIPSDPEWANVALLVSANGVDASTTIVDESDAAHPLTAEGDAQLDTTFKKWGLSSLILDGTGDYVDCQSPFSDFDFADGDWTVEFWSRMIAEPGSNITWISKWDITGNQRQWTIQYDPISNRVVCFVSTTGSNFPESYFLLGSDGVSVAEFFASDWHHVAAARSGTSIRMFVDGNVGSVVNNIGASTLFANTAIDLLIGARRSGAGIEFPVTAHMDDIRITKGVARYTGSFTPPAAEFLNN